MPNQSPDTSLSKTTPSRNSRSRRPRPNPDFLRKLQQLGYRRIVGIDEVGRGALAGPLVVGAVELCQPLNGINDSKLLPARQRERLADQIAQNARQIAFGQVSNDEIDRLGLATALALAYQRSLEQTTFDLVLTDSYALKGIRHLRAVKGDQLFYPVAAASIVAKVYRDQLMKVYHRAFPEYGWRSNVGYGTAEHFQAIRNIGPSILHRQSFLTRTRRED